jgi:succinate dehydrogenase/fumarate reductase iron-sulfur protein
MRATIHVQKFNPETDAAPRLREYHLDVAWRGNTVLDALFQIKHELDGSLTFRASCRSAICGSCPMVINGRERLACQTLVADEIDHYGRIEVRPLRQMRVIKDLAVELDPLWSKVRAITPYLTPKHDLNDMAIPQDVEGGFDNGTPASCAVPACLPARVWRSRPGF